MNFEAINIAIIYYLIICTACITGSAIFYTISLDIVEGLKHSRYKHTRYCLRFKVPKIKKFRHHSKKSEGNHALAHH